MGQPVARISHNREKRARSADPAAAGPGQGDPGYAGLSLVSPERSGFEARTFNQLAQRRWVEQSG